MVSFAELGVSESVCQALVRMKFESPTEIQAQAIPAILAGSDIIGSAQTGSGKTAAFGIPLVMKLMADPQAMALVLAPTRELASQIVTALQQLTSAAKGTLPMALLIGGASMWTQRQALLRKPRIIIATPGRLVDHMQRRNVQLDRVVYAVLDEADRMLDLGFAPQLHEIRKQLPVNRQTLFFSATFPKNIAELSSQWVKNATRITAGPVSAPLDRIEQKVIETTHDRKSDVLLDELTKREGAVLVFTRTKHGADKLARVLMNAGHRTARLHGNRSQGQRDEAITGFRKGRYRVLVATDIAARGLDIPDLAHVINFDLPRSSEDYVHRIGRTARAGRGGGVLNLVGPDERRLMMSLRRGAERGESSGDLSEGSQRPSHGGSFRGGRRPRFSRNGGGRFGGNGGRGRFGGRGQRSSWDRSAGSQPRGDRAAPRSFS